jgi:sec-independent protein translocase protein TatB
MFNVGPLELMVLLVLALIVFGPAKLPELMASAGNAIREFQRASRELTDVFQETQQEFSSALDLDLAGATVTEPAAEPSANGHTATEVADTVPVVVDAPVTTAPAEYETAAAMIDPVDPYPEPPRPPDPVAPVDETTSELGTAAGLVDDAPPTFEIKLGSVEPPAAEPMSDEALASHPVAGDPSATEPMAASVTTSEPTAGEAASAEPVPSDDAMAEPVARVRRPRRPKAASEQGGFGAGDSSAEADPDGAGGAPGPTSGISLESAAMAGGGVATAAEPFNGAAPTRRRTPRPRVAAEPAAPPTDESG